MDAAHGLLRRYFGYDSFRGLQEGVIAQLLQGMNALAVMPTGTGKSLCYQLPAVALPGTALVLSPLIALMQDQVSQLTARGISARALHSGLSSEECREALEEMRQGRLKLLYLAPERAVSHLFLQQIRPLDISLFAIDEAHCVCQWGHDFRPDYLRLASLFQLHPGAPRLALTATADPETRREMIRLLPLPQARVFLGGFDRPNIRYTILPRVYEHSQLSRFIERQPRGSKGIVYCLSRHKVEATAHWLNTQGYPALPYHAGLEASVRQRHHDLFQEETRIIMVATIAYGMGVDLPDVRFVAHLDMPRSIEAYYQETGRAGRDGRPAQALLLYSRHDVLAQSRFIQKSSACAAVKRADLERLKAMVALCQTGRCRRQVLLEYFGDRCQPCGNCDTCPPALALPGALGSMAGRVRDWCRSPFSERTKEAFESQ